MCPLVQIRTSNTVTNCLKINILRKTAEGKYEVNFAPEMWVVMQEARHLDQMGGHEIPHTILNVALQKASLKNATASPGSEAASGVASTVRAPRWISANCWKPGRADVGVLLRNRYTS